MVKRSNGVTIVLHKQVLVTQEPTDDDNRFIHHLFTATQNWIKEGMPQSNQPFLK